MASEKIEVNKTPTTLILCDSVGKHLEKETKNINTLFCEVMLR